MIYLLTYNKFVLGITTYMYMKIVADSIKTGHFLRGWLLSARLYLLYQIIFIFLKFQAVVLTNDIKFQNEL